MELGLQTVVIRKFGQLTSDQIKLINEKQKKKQKTLRWIRKDQEEDEKDEKAKRTKFLCWFLQNEKIKYEINKFPMSNVLNGKWNVVFGHKLFGYELWPSHVQMFDIF